MIRRRGRATRLLVRRYGALARAWALRHGQARPATRPGKAYDTTQHERSVRAVCEQAGPWVCAHCALDPVLTQCTVLSHCLGTLFMNTIYEHCS